MKYNRILAVILIILILQSCATLQLTKEGEAAYKDGDYKKALNSLEQVIEVKEDQGKKAEAVVYYKAGMAARKLDKTEKAEEYLDRAAYLEYAEPTLYVTLAHIYRDIDNLSKEIEALESYHETFPEGNDIKEINARLFKTYVESENWNKAVDLWPEVKEQAQDDVSLLAGYLTVNKELEEDAKSDELAAQIVKQDADNLTALEWYAFKYFWKAENTYVREMKAYQKNRTTTQYKKLLKAWDRIWPDFRKSRDYFKKLYSLEPKPIYAKYLGRIYRRMDKKQKAAYWERRAK